MSVSIRRFEREHLAQAVDVHLRAFPGFFLSFLGAGFLKEFYGSFCDSEVGIGYVAIDDQSGRVVGVVVGPLHPAGYFKRLLGRRWWAFCYHSLRAVARRPWIAPRIARAILYRGDAPPGGPRALLSSVAVDPGTQGRGIGRALVEAFLRRARDAGASGAFLTTDAEDNEAVNRFYRSSGWQVESSYTTPEGRKMNRYVLDFDSPGSPQDAVGQEAGPVSAPHESSSV